MKAFIAISMVLAVSSALTPKAFKTAPTSFNSKSFKTTPVAFKRTPLTTGGDIQVLRQDSDIQADGHYSYQYELGNGISASESGLGGQNVQGNYQYTSPEGEPIAITYTADENGYQAHGSHVPEIPSYILKSLEYIRTHAPYDGSKHAAASTKSFVATPARAAYKAPVAKAPTFRSTQTSTYKVPAKTAYKAPAKPAYKAPAKSAYKAPAKSAYKAPAKPTVYRKPQTQARRF
ncbi:Pcp family protein [Megaselia abdita]